jgi:hypothetical protein
MYISPLYSTAPSYSLVAGCDPENFAILLTNIATIGKEFDNT